MSFHFSNRLTHFISNLQSSYFVVDILHSEVLLEPYFHLMRDDRNPYRRRGNTPLCAQSIEKHSHKREMIDQDICGELCNFLFLDQPEVTVQNITPLIGHTILYQFPSPISAEYHLRFANILSLDPDENTIVLDIGNASMSNLRRRSSAYRIWLPLRLYANKIVEFVV